MVFETIDKLKQDYTDKYVVVDASRPELKRFQSMTGVIKTVNMNGRALVEFNGYDNIAWYDIDLDFLKVVDKPQEVEAPKKAKAKPAAKSATPKPAAKKATPAKPAAAKSAPAAGGAGMSMADILAAARGGDAPAAKKQPKPDPAVKPKPAAKAETKTDPSSMSVADILAAARGESSAADPEPVAEEPIAQEPAPEESVAVEPPAEASVEEAPAADAGPLPTSVDEIIAFCQKRDG